MITSSEQQLESVFLSYNRILEKLKLQHIKTKTGKEITHKDLRYAISIMEKRHPSCRWKSQRIRSKRHYILIEGYEWLRNVYFQYEKNQLDADIEFFLIRIKQYEKFLSIESKNLFPNDISVDELEKYFNRKRRTIEKAIIYMIKSVNKNYRYVEDGRFVISKLGIEWLCKNYFKHKYLELLESYKMELTEKYIEAGYIYDYYFGRN